MKHLDSLSQERSPSIGADSFEAESELMVLKDTLLVEKEGLYFPSSYQKMSYFSVREQRISAGQFVLSKSVFPFVSTSTTDLEPAAYSNPLRPAYFFMYRVQLSEDEYEECQPFAVVDWPMPHPLRFKMGKPCEVWCHSLFENCSRSILVPMSPYF